MVKLNKIYTRTGDKGETSLVNGHRVSKHSIRPTAFGTVDEVNSIIGVCRLQTSALSDKTFDDMLSRIQNDLFDLGADLATPIGEERPGEALRVTHNQVQRLEEEIDLMNASLQPLNSFVLPGGEAAAAYVHMARAMTRRAERDMTRLSTEEPVGDAAMQYINRLSDHLFVMARAINQQNGGDVLWKPAANA
jgi:cob(I)alamin adenosyltransferase